MLKLIFIYIKSESYIFITIENFVHEKNWTRMTWIEGKNSGFF